MKIYKKGDVIRHCQWEKHQKFKIDAVKMDRYVGTAYDELTGKSYKENNYYWDDPGWILVSAARTSHLPDFL